MAAVPVWLTELIIRGIVRKIKEKRMLKGKLTYTALAGILASVLSRVLGFEVGEGEVQQLVEAVLAVVAVYGRFRATRK